MLSLRTNIKKRVIVAVFARILFPVISVLLTLLIFKCVLFIGGVMSSSMELTLNKGDIISGKKIFRETEPDDVEVSLGRWMMHGVGSLVLIVPVMGQPLIYNSK